MGIKGLWTILTPFYERKPLFELQGKTVAIDLSGWVCQAQCITEYQVQPKMYLRNLYFRTCYLLMLGVNPVFVLEGAAPTLKHKTIQSRNAIQFKGAKPRAKPVSGEPAKGSTNEPAKGRTNEPAKGRTKFHYVLKQCEEMLRLMGLSCITAAGEAEAMCAYLNEKMMVDGCISQDSDCFAYGANIVYRNFSISQQGASAALGGSVDVYDLSKAQKAIDFGRQKVIGLALICGSDYNEGVFGVGREATLKLLSSIPNDEILARIRSWRSKQTHYEKLSRATDIKNNCSQCGHSGNKSKHTRNGCFQCGTSKHCKDLTETNQFNEIRNELAIRKKALEDPTFPDEDLISEFLIRKDKVNHLNLEWSKPNMLGFVKFTVKHLQWEDVYCFEKLFPILTRWCAINPDRAVIKPKCIKKKRNPKGVSSFEIIWDCECFKGFAREEGDEVKLFASIEPEDLIRRNYPELIERFNESKIKPKGRKKKKDEDGDVGVGRRTRKKKVDEYDDVGLARSRKKSVDENLDVEVVRESREKTVDENDDAGVVRGSRKNTVGENDDAEVVGRSRKKAVDENFDAEVVRKSRQKTLDENYGAGVVRSSRKQTVDENDDAGVVARSRKKTVDENDDAGVVRRSRKQKVDENDDAGCAAKKTRKKKDEGKKGKGKQTTLTQLLKTNDDLDVSCFGDEDDDADLSLVIDGIISRGVPDLVMEKIEEIQRKHKSELKGIPRKNDVDNIVGFRGRNILEGIGRANDFEGIARANDFEGIEPSNDFVRIGKPNDFEKNRKTHDFNRIAETNEFEGIGKANQFKGIGKANDFKRIRMANDFEEIPENNVYLKEICRKYGSNLDEKNEEESRNEKYIRKNESFSEDENDVEMNELNEVEKNTSHFFGDLTLGEPDLFEKTFNAVEISSSSSESEDSFDEEYVPLLERLRRKQ